jgi:hypothetical protein
MCELFAGMTMAREGTEVDLGDLSLNGARRGGNTNEARGEASFGGIIITMPHF